MRIISGKYKGRRFDPPIKKWPTRPTMDQAREALFNVLANKIDFEEQVVLDLFGGTGSISLEFLSRGCQHVHFVDKFRGCVQYLQKLSMSLELEKELKIIQSDARKYLQKCTIRYSLIFMDPPYDYTYSPELVKIIFDRHILTNKGLLVVEHDKRVDFSAHESFIEIRKYGDSYFSFFENNSL